MKIDVFLLELQMYYSVDAKNNIFIAIYVVWSILIPWNFLSRRNSQENSEWRVGLWNLKLLTITVNQPAIDYLNISIYS